MKAVAAMEVVLYIGMIAASSTLLVTQLPGMTNDIKVILSKESMIEQSRTIANLLNIISSAPDEIRITYNLPSEKSYDITVKDGLVTITIDGDSASAKIHAVVPEFSKSNTKSITITKTTTGGMVDLEIE